MSKLKIMLDAGHYAMYNPGVIVGYHEGDMSWTLQAFLKEELEAYPGITVDTTRSTSKEDRALVERGKAAAGHDLFLSLHSNGEKDFKVEPDYPVAYVMLDGSTTEIGAKLAEVVQKTIGTKQAGRTATWKGTNGEYLGVLRGAASVKVPGLVLEHSFHTNPKSCSWLMSEDNLHKLAVKEAECIAKHYGIEKEEKEVRYHGVEEIGYKEFRQVITKLMEAGILSGKAGGDLDLSEDMVRMIVLQYRGGAFDRKLIEAGMDPAVHG